MKRNKIKSDPLLILTLLVGAGVVASTLTQQLTLSDTDKQQTVSQSPIKIKNDSQPLDPNILVKVNETRQRKPANSSKVSTEKDKIRVKQPTVYQF